MPTLELVLVAADFRKLPWVLDGEWELLNLSSF